MSQEFGSEVLDLVKQKGFYHYEHMCDFKKFNETLPSKNEFDSLIRGNGIRSKDYQNVRKVWNKFEVRRMKDYNDLYLKCYVLLLVDLDEKFRSRCLENYGLYPNHYLSGPALSWDAMLSMVELDIISDVDMYLFFEKRMRGGVAYVTH